MTQPTPWLEARQLAHTLGASSALPMELGSLADSAGRVLGSDLRAPAGLPGFDTSAMDGFAVAGPPPWQVVGRSLAGSPYPAPLSEGEAVEIATGAAVPVGASAVIRSEDAELVGNRVRATVGELGRHIRRAGEEVEAGELLASAGTRVTPALIGMASASGCDWLPLHPRPNAAILLFGDELITEGPAPYGFVRDALGPAMPAWLAALGARADYVVRVADTLPAHVAAIANATATADLVITTGGTASGPVDHMHAALAQLPATLVIDRVAVRPGHPMLLAVSQRRRRGVPIVGLPGNPQSAVIALATLAEPLIAGMSGRPLPEIGTTTTAVALAAPAEEHRLIAGRRGATGFQAADHLGSAMLRGLLQAQGFAVVPPGGTGPGTTIGWVDLPS